MKFYTRVIISFCFAYLCLLTSIIMGIAEGALINASVYETSYTPDRFAPPSDYSWKTMWSYTAPPENVITKFEYLPDVSGSSSSSAVKFGVWIDGVFVESVVIYMSTTLSEPISFPNLNAASVEVKICKASSRTSYAKLNNIKVYLAVDVAEQNAVWDSAEGKSAATLAKEARNKASTAASRVWDATESKSAATLAKEARDKANQALTEINNVKGIVNNIQASVGPQILKVSGRNNATCTRTTSFDVVIQASGATEFRVKADTGSWSAWVPVGSYATTTGMSETGAHTIYVEARNAAGAVATAQMTVFKI